MCLRYELDPQVEVIKAIMAEAAGCDGEVGPVCCGEVFPGDTAPVLIRRDDEIVARPMIWGLPGKAGRPPLFNVKAETVARKALFKDLLAEHPAVIPTSGFYDWLISDGRRHRKDKFLFRKAETDMLYLAGFYMDVQAPAKSARAHFTILTGPADMEMSLYNERMPLLLQEIETAKWLEGAEPVSLLKRPFFGLSGRRV